MQKVLPALPMAWIEGVAGRVQQSDVLDPLLRWYWNMFDPDALVQFWHHQSTNDVFEKATSGSG